MDDYYFLDDSFEHEVSSATYWSSKDPVTSDHLRKQQGMANTPENCTIDERTMEYLEASYNKMLTDHVAGPIVMKHRNFMNQLLMQQYSQ